MASTSSSPIVLSPSPKYDVFLSFRGEDTRHSFTDHLYEALKRTGLHIFRDNNEIPRGEELGPEIEAAIKASKASIIVLSKNYATSSWCLRELSLILERRRKFQHFVLPVFYLVDPSHVKKHKESFMIEVETSSLTWTDDNVKRWKEALTEVAELTGLVLSGSESEAAFVDKIIAEIYHKVYSETIILPCYLTGMKAQDEYIKLWLGNPDIKVLAICGMGGSGKTTLARYILSISPIMHLFEKFILVEDMGCQNQNDSNELFRKFASDLLGKGTVSYTKETVYRFLQTKRALIVFDDVEEPNMLERYLGPLDIHKQSKIIITTRKSNTHDWFKHRSWRCQEYKMQLLDVDESLELLSLHAFGSKNPREGYNELAKEALQYCEGNPLALEVLGSSLAEHINIPFWRSQLDLLKINLDLKLQNVLIRSYHALPHDLTKELFLYIACFFVGEDKDYVQNILETAYCALSGIEGLTSRCLLSVSPNNKLTMHRLIQEMGRNIIRQQSNIPRERTIVWLSKESYKIMRKGKRSDKIKGLALDMQMLDKQKEFVHRQESESLKTDSLRNMDYLELLQLNNVHLTGSYESFSEELLWLCWRGFGLEAIPSGLFQQNLVAIDMKDSKLEIFESPIVLVSLKTLNLQGSSLSEIRNISRLPNLETLILCHCKKLQYGCESIGGLMNLTQLNINGCERFCWDSGTISDTESQQNRTSLFFFLKKNTTSFSLPHSLVWLSAQNCNIKYDIPLTSNGQLKYLDLGHGWFNSLPRYNHLENLRVLDLTLCPFLGQLLCLPSALEELYVYFCGWLEKITFESHQFTLKEFGYQGCYKLSEVEGFFKLEPVAMIYDLGHLKWLKVYKNLEVRLVGDDYLTYDDFTFDGRNRMEVRLTMLYEFGIMSISLPDIKDDPNTISEHLSESPSVTFSVPPDPRRLKGLNVTFKYTISDKECVWFIKIRTIKGTINDPVDYTYHPFVFGDPGDGNVGIWLSYWPIGSTLHVGDQVTASIVAMSGLEVHECGATLVYEDDGEEDGILNTNLQWVETIGGDLSGFRTGDESGASLVYEDDGEEDGILNNNTPLVDTIGGDLSGFRLSTGAYYLCRRDFFHLMEVGRLTPGWLSTLVGYVIDDTEVRGWRKTGRPGRSFELSNPSFTKLKTF